MSVFVGSSIKSLVGSRNDVGDVGDVGDVSDVVDDCCRCRVAAVEEAADGGGVTPSLIMALFCLERTTEATSPSTGAGCRSLRRPETEWSPMVAKYLRLWRIFFTSAIVVAEEYWQEW